MAVQTFWEGGDALKGDAEVVWVEEASGVVEEVDVLRVFEVSRHGGDDE